MVSQFRPTDEDRITVHECLICNSRMTWSFAKDFDGFGLSRVAYWRCGNCGFVISKTHAEMSSQEWESHNRSCHGAYQATETNTADPRWLSRLRSQARMLDDCIRIGLLKEGGKRVDYACGDGKLADLLATQGHVLGKYDRYMRRDAAGYLADEALRPGGFDLVVTTSVFEHLFRREDFDAIDALVSRDGVMGLHTLVCERVPDDPSWFYLQPPHCAFHTNASMALLFRQWGYRASIYNVDAQLWLWFRDDAGVQSIVEAANARGDGHCTYHYKAGFMDYWKQRDVTRSG